MLCKKNISKTAVTGKRVIGLFAAVISVCSLSGCKTIAKTLTEAVSDIDSTVSDIPHIAAQQKESDNFAPDSDEETRAETILPTEETVLPTVESEESPHTEEPSKAVGIRPEFKEAMDSYEAFFKEYVDFLKKYEESDNALSMLSDYLDYVSKYAEMYEKLDAIDTSELSDEETAYYMETMARITKLLGELY